MTTSSRPQYPDQCPKCKKSMEVMGLTHPYPPKQLTTDPYGGTRWECPHCKTPVGGRGGTMPGFAFWAPDEELQKLLPVLPGTANSNVNPLAPMPADDFDALVQQVFDDYLKRMGMKP